MILHVTECYAGGVSRAINAAASLATDHEHHLIYSGGDTPPPGVFASARPFRKGIFARTMQLRAVVNELKPTLLHAHSSWAGVYSRLLRLPVAIAYQPHGYKFEDPESPRLLRTMYRLAESALARRADVVVVLSPREDDLASELSPRTPRVFMPNVASLRPSTCVDKSAANRVFMIGRLSRQKDPLYFARVAELVRVVRPDIEFVWVGDGDAAYRSQLEAEGITVTGWLNQQDLATFLDEPGIYLHSAAYEGFPLSLLDAAAFGHLVVARRIPALAGTSVAVEESEEKLSRLLLGTLSGTVEDVFRASQARVSLPEMMSPERQTDALFGLYASNEQKREMSRV